MKYSFLLLILLAGRVQYLGLISNYNGITIIRNDRIVTNETFDTVKVLLGNELQFEDSISAYNCYYRIMVAPDSIYKCQHTYK